MKDIKVSIAMTMYNGEKYIVEQLKTIMNQTRTADEVVIVDDKSTDHCVELVENFIETNHLKNWQLVKNDKNVGWKKNFYKAAGYTTGDVVFFSDQDDIWMPNKIEKMLNVMINMNAGGVYCESIIVDQDGNILKERQSKKRFSGKISVVRCTKSFLFSVFLGCRCCFKREVIDKYLSLGFDDGDHDSQCGRIALLISTMYRYDEPLIKYRIHKNNNSGVVQEGSIGFSNINKRISTLEELRGWIECASNDSIINNNKKLFLKLSNMLAYRIGYLNNQKGFHFFGLLKYSNLYPSFASLIGDYSYKHGINLFFGKMIAKLKK